jgi:hypothetical protein
MKRVNERTRVVLLVSFENEDRRLTAPATMRWRVYCETTGSNITDWADETVPATGQVEIEIPASATAILNDSNYRETKVVAVEADYGTDNQASDEFRIDVKNLQVTA